MSRERDEWLLAALAGLLPEQRPADEAGLRERILARATGPRTRVLRADEGEWVPFFPGIRIKTLRRDERAGTQTTLWRLAPGAVVPPHPHHHEEECLVIEGSVVHRGEEFVAGDYLLAPEGERHQPFVSPNGALLLIRSELLPDPERLRALLGKKD